MLGKTARRFWRPSPSCAEPAWAKHRFAACPPGRAGEPAAGAWGRGILPRRKELNDQLGESRREFPAEMLVFAGIVSSIIELEKINGLIPIADPDYEISP